MAYKRTTKSSKTNGITSRRTTSYNDRTGKRTYSNSQSTGTSTTTRNTNGDVWLTTNNNGWITKRKIVSGKPKAAPKPRKARRKKSTATAGSPAAGLWLLAIIGIIIYTVFFK